MTLQQRLELARNLRKNGRNCAQTVLMAFPDITGLSDDMAARISNSLGSGIGMQREICGVPTAMAITDGMRFEGSPEAKPRVYASANKLLEKFRHLNDNKITCRELKKPGAPKSCDQLIMEGIEILHNSLESDGDLLKNTL